MAARMLKITINRTASRHNEVKLTEEELKFYEVRNPIQEALERNEGGFFQKVLN